MQGLLHGVRVLDLCDERGLLCGRILADMGADVVRIEPPGGSPVRRRGARLGGSDDPERSVDWLAWAAGSRGITLDPTRPRGRDILDRLCERADLLVETLETDALKAAGLDWPTVSARWPRLVVCSITPFGRSGPYSAMRGSDLTVTAMGGNMALTGDQDRAPLRCTMPSSHGHGAAEAATGALVALFARETTGRGQHVDVSLQACVVATIMTGASQWWLDRRDRHRSGALYVVGDTRQREVWACRDGFVSYGLRGGPARLPGLVAMARWMAESGIDAPAWQRDWTTYDHLDLSQEEVDAISAPLQRFFLGRTMRELFEGSLARKIMLAPVNDSREIAASEQLASRGFFADVPDPGRGLSLRMPARFARATDADMDVRGPAPRIGEHNAEVYGELGIGPDALRELAREGVV
ncbi:MAG: CaiB/BaiF CoA transferase family protein [Alphaproteobacteria bacterium]